MKKFIEEVAEMLHWMTSISLILLMIFFAACFKSHVVNILF